MNNFNNGDAVNWTFTNNKGINETIVCAYQFAAKIEGLAVIKIPRRGNMDMLMVPFSELKLA